jgi:hypothetical protein
MQIECRSSLQEKLIYNNASCLGVDVSKLGFFSGGFSCECKTPLLHGQDLPKSKFNSSREDLSATIECVLVSVCSFEIWNFGCMKVIVVW